MWSFTSALFLLELFPGSMLLPAIHGFITGLCVILFGALIGEWVDRTTRLKGESTKKIPDYFFAQKFPNSSFRIVWYRRKNQKVFFFKLKPAIFSLAVRIALATQNSAVALGSFILTMAFVFKDSISDSGKLGCVVGFLLFAIIGDCASVVSNSPVTLAFFVARKSFRFRNFKPWTSKKNENDEIFFPGHEYYRRERLGGRHRRR